MLTSAVGVRAVRRRAMQRCVAHLPRTRSECSTASILLRAIYAASLGCGCAPDLWGCCAHIPAAVLHLSCVRSLCVSQQLSTTLVLHSLHPPVLLRVCQQFCRVAMSHLLLVSCTCLCTAASTMPAALTAGGAVCVPIIKPRQNHSVGTGHKLPPRHHFVCM